MTDETIATKIYRFKKVIRLPDQDIESAEGSDRDSSNSMFD